MPFSVLCEIRFSMNFHVSIQTKQLRFKSEISDEESKKMLGGGIISKRVQKGARSAKRNKKVSTSERK